MCLIVQVKAIGNQLFDIDFRRTIPAPLAAAVTTGPASAGTIAAPVTTTGSASSPVTASFAAALSSGTVSAWSATTAARLRLARRTVAAFTLFSFLLFCLSHG
jgi:hypothetical protein